MQTQGEHYRTVWMEGGVVRMINQPLLPHQFEIVSLADYHACAEAISRMVVRGAPAIGATGAYGMAQAVLAARVDTWLEQVNNAAKELAATRPTARDLFNAIERMRTVIAGAGSFEEARRLVVEAADDYADSSAAACERIGTYGAELIRDGFRVLTHCNAGWLACVDWGTALSPVYKAARQGKKVFVYADETRPRLQGAQLTAYELCGEKIPHAIIADNAAGYYIASGQIDMVIVGTDRTARNGDVANKIGTYEKAVLAQRHGVPFYVAAPSTSIDFDCESGAEIPIEHRHQDEVLYVTGRDEEGGIRRIRIAPAGSQAFNPAFDVTPSELVTGIITEKGIFKPGDIAANEFQLRAV
jgi:S-methyl-5-thioribose-1-phosphate isomerase